MKTRLAWLWGVALLMTACVAHEKVGDQAAAVGDWKTALAHYRTALSKEPESPELQAKYQRARQEAVTDAYRKAQACAAAGNWSCALGEADFALEVDSGNMEIATFRANAARSHALAQISQSREEARRNNFRFALQLTERARALSGDPAVAQEATQARAELASLADAEAGRLHKQKAYPEALEALSVAAAIDGSKRGKLEALQREYDAHLAAEYERLAREGDQALARRDWNAATTHYQAALKLRSGGRADPLARYAGSVAHAEAALAHRDYLTAAQVYRQAVDTGQDTSGYAAAQLQLVEVRPYSVRIRSVLARPLRPDGNPWGGRMHPYLSRLASLLMNEGYLDSGNRGASRRIIDAALSIPMENRPTLAVRATLPDGTLLSTPASTGLYVVYESEFVVATNAFDERRLHLRVVHGNSAFPEDVGVMEFALGDIVRRRQAHLSAQSVAELHLLIEPAPGRTDGMFANMSPLYDGTHLAQDYSVPTATSAGYRLKAVHASISPQAVADEADEGAPELVFELIQGGRTIYRSPQLDNLYEGQWSTSNVTLFVEPGEQLQLRVWDMDSADHDLLVDAPITADMLRQGKVRVSSANGSSATLHVEPRGVWKGEVASSAQ